MMLKTVSGATCCISPWSLVSSSTPADLHIASSDVSSAELCPMYLLYRCDCSPRDISNAEMSSGRCALCHPPGATPLPPRTAAAMVGLPSSLAGEVRICSGASSPAFRLRGTGPWMNVQSCLWYWQRMQGAASCKTHLLFRRRQPSQGRSNLGRLAFSGAAFSDELCGRLCGARMLEGWYAPEHCEGDG